MEDNNSQLKQIFINLGFIIATDFVLAFVIALIWNTAGVWLVPELSAMTYWVALGLSTLFIFGDMLVKYWINRFIAIRQAKALKALQVADTLMYELSVLKQVLRDKGIL